MSFKESYLEDRQRKIETLKNVVEDYEDDINMFDIIDEEDMCVKTFTEYGFLWGGNCWDNRKDYQYFFRKDLN